MFPVIYDVIILLVLALFLWRGWRTGLLLSLCGLVVLAVSFLGAGFLADTLDEPLANALEPTLASSIEKQLSSHAEELTIQSPLEVLQDMGGLYKWAADALEDAGDAVGSAVGDTVHTVALRAARYAAVQLAHTVLFAVFFLLLAVLLTLLLHALDLVAKLPGLHFCNGVGGAVIGLGKGVLVLFVLVSLLCLTPYAPSPDAADRTYLLPFFLNYNPISALLSA